ncbi:MAG: hypothetical protein HC922_10435 [Leptolyngbyaceae cyanobacterium SM2_3_12]|nr:hypothetical protein [Leptolyngbyaceae cyanobacterium SM2_3_12]
MSQDVTQWITEVRTLQRQLADTRKERDQAYNSAANWRRLYEIEARQRREDGEQWRHQVEALQQELQGQAGASAVGIELVNGLEASASLEALQSKLEVLVSRCQELTQRLQAEQQAHAETRQSLTAALGDAFDAWRPERALATRLPEVGHSPSSPGRSAGL